MTIQSVNGKMKLTILVTGISGFIGSFFFKNYLLNNNDFFVIGIDRVTPDFSHDIDTFINGCLTDENTYSKLFTSVDTLDVVVHFAASRTDNASYYFYNRDNILATQSLVKNLTNYRLRKVIHIGSVATIRGQSLSFNSQMSSDDLYRSSKYIQENIVVNFCKSTSTSFVVLNPSAVYSPDNRLDTNIGSLKAYSKFLPFIPDIPVKKSLTNLSIFCSCINSSLMMSHIEGNFIVIDNPVLTVSQIIKSEYPDKKIISIPFFKNFLTLFSILGSFISLILNIDCWLKNSRIKKLYESTDYSNNKDFKYIYSDTNDSHIP